MSNLIKEFKEDFKRKKSGIAFFVIFSLGYFLHFRNLKGAVCLISDEVRAFTLMRSGAIIYLLTNPVYRMFKQVSATYYFIGTLSLCSVIFLYLITKLLFNKKIAFFTSLIYVCFPFRIHFTRLLYPVVFIDFFLLLLVLTLIYALIKKKYYLISVSGLVSSILFVTHPLTYSILFGLGIAILLAWYINRKTVSFKKVVFLALTYFAFLFIGYYLLEQLFMAIKPGYILTQQLFDFHNEVLAGIDRDGKNAAPFISGFLHSLKSSPQNLTRNCFVIFAVLFSIFAAFRKNTLSMLKYPLVTLIAGLSIFLVMGLKGVHETWPRHFVWTASFLSLSTGVLITSVFSSKNAVKKTGIVLFACFFLTTSLYKSYLITTEMFRTDEIQGWLNKNNIQKSKILTFLMLDAPGDEKGTQHIPVYLNHVPHKIFPKKHEISWNLIFGAYQKGMFKYIIPSGVGSLAYIGEEDKMLDFVKPKKTWDHPYSSFRHRFEGSHSNIKIKLYDLDQVFSEQNLIFVSSPLAKLFNGKDWCFLDHYVSGEEALIYKKALLQAAYQTSFFNNRPILNAKEGVFLQASKHYDFIEMFYKNHENRKMPLSIALSIADKTKNNKDPAETKKITAYVIESLRNKGLLK